ncbi:hypothetical protein DFH11DRAFT_1587940, partial [Phellopilus nigrolimitatus]
HPLSYWSWSTLLILFVKKLLGTRLAHLEILEYESFLRFIESPDFNTNVAKRTCGSICMSVCMSTGFTFTSCERCLLSRRSSDSGFVVPCSRCSSLLRALCRTGVCHSLARCHAHPRGFEGI